MGTLLPNVSHDMLTPEFWLQHTSDSVSTSGQEKVQRCITEKSASIISLARLMTEGLDWSSAEWAEKFGPRLTPPETTLFDESGKAMTSDTWRSLIANASFDATMIRPQPGFSVHRADVRRWPTSGGAYKSAEDREFDRFQDTALHTFEAVIVLTESRDQEWYYLLSTTYRGWVRQTDIALCTWEEFERWSNLSDFIIPLSNHVYTQAAPYDRTVSKKWLEFAAYIPVCDDEESGKSFGNQTPVGNVSVWLPIRNNEGRLSVRKGFVSDRAAIHRGFLPFTRASVLSSAFALLTERYGWGDSFGNHDCSSLVMDVYRTVGVQLPRDTGAQEEVLPNRVDFPDRASFDERSLLLRSLQAGDPLYMPGHTMLYLGFVDGHHYVIHDFAGYAYMSGDDLHSVPVNEVMVSTLDILTGKGRTYLDELTSGGSLFGE